MNEEIELKTVFNIPNIKTVKQPEVLSPNDFLDFVDRVDYVGSDPLISLRNQCMLLMTFCSCFRAIEVSQWKVKECLEPNGDIHKITRIRKEGTKGKYAIKAPVVFSEQRKMLDAWLNARVAHEIGMIRKEERTGQYRDLDPESHVFMSNWRGRWQNFSLTRKVSKGKEYQVATAVQNLLTKLYKRFGFPNSSSHAGRHSFARFVQKLFEKSGNPNAQLIIQNLLHHRTEEAQRDYTDINFHHLRKCADDIMPRPKKRGPKPQ